MQTFVPAHQLTIMQRIEDQIHIARHFIKANGPEVIGLIVIGYCLHFVIEGAFWIVIFIVVQPYIAPIIAMF